MQLKESLTLLQKGDQSIFNYMQVVRTIVDELVMIDTPLSNDDITLYVLNGLGTNYKDIMLLYEQEKHH
jgi:DNA-binding MltR family transcriptional regulator